MPTIGTHATGGKSGKRNGARLGARVGRTINGASLDRVDMMATPIPWPPDVSRGGAVAGAAQVMVMSSGFSNGEERAVALSDGSRSSFASIAALGLFKAD